MLTDDEKRELIVFTERESKRFWEKVDKNPWSGCWEWGGHLNFGYGHFYFRRRSWRVHRLAYSVMTGPIPEGAVLDHLCRNRACVNPDHLEAVDSRTNTLRGFSPIADQARQTHCKRGHELSEDNLYPTSSGFRMCRTCDSRQGNCPECGKEMRRANIRRHIKEQHV